MRHNLSDVIALIKDRRTIYPEQYSTREILKEQVESILNAAIWAPTHGNTQPWRFTVFMGESKIELADFLAKTYFAIVPQEKQNDKKLSKMITRPAQSSVVIAVCMKRDPTKKIKEIEEIEAVACAIQNMYLMATSYGIGSFWSTSDVYYSQQMKDFLNLKEDDFCLGLFFLGYPKIEWPQGQRRPIEYVTTWK